MSVTPRRLALAAGRNYIARWCARYRGGPCCVAQVIKSGRVASLTSELPCTGLAEHPHAATLAVEEKGP